MREETLTREKESPGEFPPPGSDTGVSPGACVYLKLDTLYNSWEQSAEIVTMMRQASSRNQRNKGLRVKNVLQICLLAAVFFWLLYQLKHSYDKKKGLDEHNSRILTNVINNQPNFIDLGRKDLPRDKVTVSGDKTYNKDEENEGVEEEEEEAQRAIEAEEAKGFVDDGIDEQDDQERGDEEAEDGEETVNEEDKEVEVEEAEFLDDQEHGEGSSQEAREESYKRDDASSAVHRENQVTGTEDKNGSVDEEQLKNNVKNVEIEYPSGRKDDGSKDNNSMSVAIVVATGNDTIQNNSLALNGAAVEKFGRELSPADNQTKLQVNSTMASLSDNQVNLQTDSLVAVTSKETEGKANTVPLENETLNGSSVDNQNTTIALRRPEEDNSNLKSVLEEQPKKSSTMIGQDNLEELSAISIGVNENGDAVEEDSAGSMHRMVTEEERDAHIDLSILPEIHNDVKNIEDEAAE